MVDGAEVESSGKVRERGWSMRDWQGKWEGKEAREGGGRGFGAEGLPSLYD